MESSDGWSLGWEGVDALWSVFQPGAPGDPKPRTAAPARPEPKFDATGARARLYDQRIAYAEKATEAVALTAALRAWRPEEPRRSRLVVIGETGLEEARVRASLASLACAAEA